MEVYKKIKNKLYLGFSQNSFWNIDLERSITNYFQNNWNVICLFLSLFIINVLIYGQKLFHHSLATDDYGRFFSTGVQHHAGWLGRWLGGIVNSFVFIEGLSILPYFNVLIGIFCVTLTGFLSALILKQNKFFNIIIITLLCSVTIFFAKNFFFNTNTPVWISTLLGVYGLYIFYNSRSTLSKILAIILIAGAVSCYQTILQVCLMIVVLKVVLELFIVVDKVQRQKIIKSGLYAMGLLFFAVVIYFVLNKLYIEYFGLEVSARYKEVTQMGSFYKPMFDIDCYIKKIFHRLNQYSGLFFAMFLLSFFSVIALFMRLYLRFKPMVSILSTLLLFFLFVIILGLPRILGVGIPWRAEYTLGWFMAGCFLFTLNSTKVIKNIGILLAIGIIVINSFYINIYFYYAYRQTQSDIIRANQIVSTIRIKDNYQTEPLEFYIEGKKDFLITGFLDESVHQAALSNELSKYTIFEHFTDFNFQIMDGATYRHIEQSIIHKGNLINSYPAKNSIFLQGKNVILFLNTDEINAKIQKLQK